MGHVFHKFQLIADGWFRTEMGKYGFHGLQRGTLPRNAFLVGIFGVNFPFLLRETYEGSQKYKLLAYASLHRGFQNIDPDFEHKLGHDFILNAVPNPRDTPRDLSAHAVFTVTFGFIEGSNAKWNETNER